MLDIGERKREKKREKVYLRAQEHASLGKPCCASSEEQSAKHRVRQPQFHQEWNSARGHSPSLVQLQTQPKIRSLESEGRQLQHAIQPEVPIERHFRIQPQPLRHPDRENSLAGHATASRRNACLFEDLRERGTHVWSRRAPAVT
jgi:hypothetical protein